MPHTNSGTYVPSTPLIAVATSTLTGADTSSLLPRDIVRTPSSRWTCKRALRPLSSSAVDTRHRARAGDFVDGMEQQLQRSGAAQARAQAGAVGDPVDPAAIRIHGLARDHRDALRAGLARIDEHGADLRERLVGMEVERDHVALPAQLLQHVDPLLVRTVTVTVDHDVAAQRQLGLGQLRILVGDGAGDRPIIGVSGRLDLGDRLRGDALALLPADHRVLPAGVRALARARETRAHRDPRALGRRPERERRDDLALELRHRVL